MHMFDYFLILFLFAVLCIYADLAVKNIKIVASRLGLSLFSLGVILGLATSLPEFALGLSASFRNASDISVGNLLGGVLVIFGLILGLSLVINRRVATDGQIRSIVLIAGALLLPLVLGLDGRLGNADGLLIMAVYLLLLFYLFYYNSREHNYHFASPLVDSGGAGKAILYAIIGVLTVIVSSNWLMATSIRILDRWQLSGFFVGMVFFAIGTNLPEIIISLNSFRRKAAELSLSHLISSSIANTGILGLVVFIRPAHFLVDQGYWILFTSLFVILALFTVFYHTGKKLGRWEGAILATVYLLFIILSWVGIQV